MSCGCTRRFLPTLMRFSSGCSAFVLKFFTGQDHWPLFFPQSSCFLQANCSHRVSPDGPPAVSFCCKRFMPGIFVFLFLTVLPQSTAVSPLVFFCGARSI